MASVRGQAAAGSPTVVAVVSEDTSAQVGILRFRECGSSQAILAGTDVQRTIEDCQRRDCVAAIGRTTIDPLLPVVTEDTAALVRLGLTGSDVELAIEYSHAKDEDGGAEPAVVLPVDSVAARVDAEVDMSIIRLGRRNAGVGLNAEVQAGSGDGVVL